MPYILPRLYVSLEMRLIKSKKKIIYLSILCGGLRFLIEKTYDIGNGLRLLVLQYLGIYNSLP